MVKVSPSLLSADFSNLREELKKVIEAGADRIHFDIMDGHFVPNITFGAMVLKSLRRFTDIPFEAHLMITNPDKYWRDFVEAGADIIGIHIECKVNHRSLIEKIKSSGRKVCIVVNPPTEIEKIYPFIEIVDEVLIMSVNPGFGGQKFIPEVVPKIEILSKLRREKNLKFLIEVDGGINEETARIVKKAGADILVAGSFIFKGENYRERIMKLK